MAASLHPSGCRQTLILSLCLFFTSCERASADESFAVLNFAYKGFSCLRPSHTLSTVPVPSAVMIYHVHRRPSERGELQASLVLVTAGFLSSCAFNKAPVFGFLLPLPDLPSAV